MNLSPLQAAKQAIADPGTHYTEQELRSILANLVEYIETPVRVTGFAPGFEPPNDTLDYSNYK